MLDDLIFDRNQDDINNNTFKAYHNISDLNRIESWCEYIAGILNQYNYNIEIITKNDWVRSDMYTLNALNRIKNNVNTIKNAYYVKQDTPVIVADKTTINIIDANTIEKILYDVDELLNKMIADFRACGTFSCNGMEGLI